MTRRTLIKSTVAAVTVVAVLGGVGVLWRLPLSSGSKSVSIATGDDDADIIYYQHPDGSPRYSLVPSRTPEGRDYRPVRKGADISFDTDEPSPAPQEASTGRKIKYYRNPMGLPDTSPVPKKDWMGMDYIAVFDGDDGVDDSISLTPGKIQRTGVKSEAAAMRVLQTIVRAPGVVQLDERRISVVSMRAEGWLPKVEDVTTGTRVSKGQPLFHFYSPAIVSAAADYIALLRSPSYATPGDSLGRGSRQRLVNLDLPEAVIQQIETSRVIPLSVVWSAPREGIVLERNAVEGMRTQPGDVLFRLADTSIVWVIADVSERDLGLLHIGQPVAIQARAFPDRTFSGTVGVIYPQFNRETRTVRLRIELSNPDLALLPDMYVQTEIDTGTPMPVLTVPESAVIDNGTRQVVFIDKGEGRFEPREIAVGRRGSGFVEVREGLADGQAVVVAANFLIDAESNLKAALKGFSEAGTNQ
jgi:Cu(I)/Ag(I) efflux system membrane fusion protein